ncbi:hypothetical protein [Anaeropeptidivorans aminofermentans]|uniref:hypothetical protein n=1 Tax=Anaeropeptidivorans aminofermentans TaxID=2934315 RepID=UPI002025731B|nr:hypothetical protein [Anaeropeptidivorans aminofermentans]MBE6013639.1 hypothetical protein [Lachnospiraceae bacterium]
METKNPITRKILKQYKISSEELITDTGNHYFIRAENIKDNQIKSLMLQIICNIMSESQIFLEDASKYTQHKNINSLIISDIPRLYKVSGMYIVFMFLKNADMPLEYKEAVKEGMIKVFNYSKGEIKKIKYFFGKAMDQSSIMELEMNLYICTILFKNKLPSPLNLALMSNFLYNSYMRFLENYDRYVKFRKTA